MMPALVAYSVSMQEVKKLTTDIDYRNKLYI